MFCCSETTCQVAQSPCHPSSCAYCGTTDATDYCNCLLGPQIFERLDLENSGLTSAELAVKRFARTVRHGWHINYCVFYPVQCVATCTALCESWHITVQIDDSNNAPEFFRTRGALSRTMAHLRTLLDRQAQAPCNHLCIYACNHACNRNFVRV